MVAFLLGLLKIIGIVLLILLILLLVIVGAVLFVPLRYQAEGRISEEKKEAKARVTWLLKAVRVGVDYVYPESPTVSVKFFWIDVLKFLERSKNKTPKKARKGRISKETEPTGADKQTETVKEQEQGWETLSEQDIEELSGVSAETDTKEENGDFREKIENIIFKITSVYDKIKNIIANIQYYIAVLQEEETKQLLSDAWGMIVKILKSICPRVFEVKGEFGFDSPDTTGQVYGAYCVVRPMLGEHVQLVPNFEEKVLRGKLYMKGQITVFVILVNVLRIVFDKRLNPLINKLKNGGSQNGGE